jgi:hypothetical protein
MQSRTLSHIVQKGLELREIGHTWDEISTALNILTENGRIDPGLAKRIIADGYEPKRQTTRDRLGLTLICVACGTRIKRVVPDWLNQAVANLQRLEAAATPKPDEYRVYARGGKRVRGARPYSSGPKKN